MNNHQSVHFYFFYRSCDWRRIFISIFESRRLFKFTKIRRIVYGWICWTVLETLFTIIHIFCWIWCGCIHSYFFSFILCLSLRSLQRTNNYYKRVILVHWIYKMMVCYLNIDNIISFLFIVSRSYCNCIYSIIAHKRERKPSHWSHSNSITILVIVYNRWKPIIFWIPYCDLNILKRSNKSWRTCIRWIIISYSKWNLLIC